MASTIDCRLGAQGAIDVALQQPGPGLRVFLSQWKGGAPPGRDLRRQAPTLSCHL